MNSLRRTGILFLFCFLTATFALAQSPVVSTQAGYPVGLLPGKQIAYGNSRYLILTYNNNLYQSTNGTNWSKIQPTGLTGTDLSHIGFGAGLFVVISNTGVIQTSTDGTTWTSRTSGTTEELRKVYFENGKFFVVGANRTLLTSADGITWTKVTFNVGSPTDMFMSLSFGNGAYVIGARNNSNILVYRSTTAASNSWTYTNHLGPGDAVNRIQFLHDRFFIFNSSSDMYSSPDGINWTKFSNSSMLTQPDNTTIPWGPGHQIFNGVWDGTRYYFYGSSAYHNYGSTYTSTDGVNLTLQPKSVSFVPQESQIINGTFFVVGNEGFVTSSNGLTYQFPGSSFNDLVKTANKYVAVGSVSQDGQIYNSTDFATWTNRTPAGLKEVYAAAYDGTRILAAGSQYVVSSTDDGDSWTTVFDGPGETIAAMAYGNGMFVAGGYNTMDYKLSYSMDGGQTWLQSNSDYNNYVKIKYVNNRFFAMGSDAATWLGKIMYSTDGISWTDVTPSTPYDVYYYKDVAFDGTKYHFLGVEMQNFTPTGTFTISTVTPEDASSYGNKATITNIPAGVVLAGNYDQGTLDYSGGKFTGSMIDYNTGQDYLLYSTNGTSWTAAPQNTASTISATYVSGTTVRMVSRGNAYYTVNHSGVLPVSLLRFQGRLEEGRVQLNWATSSEQNSREFRVQHSTDGLRWHTLGTVAAAGHSTLEKQYRFAHMQPAPGHNFYRLQQQDRDGSSTQSRIVTIQYSGRPSVSIYPNPAADRLVIWSAEGTPGQAILYNAAGMAVKRTLLTGTETVIRLNNLPAGTYVAEIQQGGSKERITIVKH